MKVLATRRLDFEGVCWALIIPALLIDSLSGFAVQQLGLDLKISLLYKALLLVLLTFSAVRWRPRLIAILAPMAALILSRPLYQVLSGDATAVRYDLPIAFRILLIPALLAFAFRSHSADPSRFLRNAHLTLLAGFVILLANILAGLVGIGFPTYPSTGLGSKGFFVAGNEVSAVLIACSAYVLYSLWRSERRAWYWLITLLVVISSGLLATKAAVLSSIVLAFAFPLLGTPHRPLSPSRLLVVSAAFVLAAVFAFNTRDVLSGTPFGQRVAFVYDRLGAVELIFSGRLEFVSRFSDTLRANASVQDLIFGFGSSRLLGFGPAMVEIDPIDTAIMFGVPLSLLLLSLAILSVAIPSALLYRRQYGPPVLVANALLLFFAVTAGHVWTSGMLQVYWIILNGLLLIRVSNVAEASRDGNPRGDSL